jgi:hypothetical protein
MFQVAASYEVAGSSGDGLSFDTTMESVLPTTIAELSEPLPPEPPQPASTGALRPSRAGSTSSLLFILVVLPVPAVGRAVSYLYVIGAGRRQRWGLARSGDDTEVG